MEMAHQETADDEEMEEEEAPLQMPPRTRHKGQHGDGSGPEKDNVPTTHSVVVEPRTTDYADTERLEPVTMVQEERELESTTQPGLQTQQ